MSATPRSTDSASAPGTGTPAAAKPRNPVERAVVWILIGGMLIVVAVEASAKFGYDSSRAALDAAIKSAEDSNTPLKIEDVPALLSGYHRDTNQESEYDGVTSYRWPSLFKQYGLNVQYRSHLRTVIGFSSENAAPEEPRMIAGGAEDEAEETEDDATGGDEQPSAGEGRGRFDPMQYDADQDGRLSKAEVAESERMTENFDRIDANADGQLDAEELTAWRASRARPAGDGAAPAGGDAPAGGPRRPEAETPPENAPTGDAPAANPPAADAPAAPPSTAPPQ